MRFVLAHWVEKAWFDNLLNGVAPLLGAAIGYFAAHQMSAIVLIVIFAAISFVSNHFSFKTLEMHFFIAVWLVASIVTYSIDPALSTAIAGFVAGLFFAQAALTWMDEPNRIEAERQARVEQDR